MRRAYPSPQRLVLLATGAGIRRRCAGRARPRARAVTPAIRASRRRCRRSTGRPAADIVGRDDGIQGRPARRHDHGPHRQGILRRGDPGDRRSGMRAEIGGRACATSRRHFVKGRRRRCARCRCRRIAQGAGPQVVVIGGGFAGATARALPEAGEPAHHGDAGRDQPDLHRLPVLQRRDRAACASCARSSSTTTRSPRRRHPRVARPRPASTRRRAP